MRSLGDAILTIPLIEALHQWRPDLRQSILIEAPYAPVFLNHPAIDRVLVLKRKGSADEGWTRLRSFLELRKLHYPAVLNLHGGTTSRILCLACGSKLRIGQLNHRGSWIYNRHIPPSAGIWNRRSVHTVEHQLSPMRWMGLPTPMQPPTLYLNDEARRHIEQRLASEGKQEFILIQPTATLATKQWDQSKFAQLGDWLSRRYMLPVIYTAAPHENPVLEAIKKTARERHSYWSDLPLADLFALIERCRIFIGCDSGPMHAAAALKKPVVVVWGSSSFDNWHPWGTRYEAVRSELPCMPCPGYTCKSHTAPRCILDIPVSRVIDACTRILESPLTQI